MEDRSSQGWIYRDDQPYIDEYKIDTLYEALFGFIDNEIKYLEKELTMDQAFYIVWSPSGVTNPKVTFRTEAGAKAEAERMGLYHQRKFHWCKVMGSTEPPPKMITKVFA